MIKKYNDILKYNNRCIYNTYNEKVGIKRRGSMKKKLYSWHTFCL